MKYIGAFRNESVIFLGINSFELSNKSTQDIKDDINSVNDNNNVLIANAYVSELEFQYNRFELYPGDEGYEERKAEIDRILKREEKFLEDLGFISFNEYIYSGDFNTTYIYPNKAGLALKRRMELAMERSKRG